MVTEKAGGDIIFTIEIDKLTDLLDRMNDLTCINDNILMEIDTENILIYTIAGGKSINAFNNHILKTSEYIKFNKTCENKIKFIFTNSKKFIKKLSHYKDFNEEVKVRIVYDSNFNGNRILFKNDKLKMDDTGGMPMIFKQEISIDNINSYMDISKSNFNFELTKEDYTKVKKLSSIDGENEIYNLTIKDNIINIGEKNWSLKVAEIETPNDHITFRKNFFNTLRFDDNQSVKIYIFNTFILILSNKSNLMITTEFNG